MSESKQGPNPSEPRERPSPTGPLPQPPVQPLLSREELDELSPLQVVDLISTRLPHRHAAILDLVYLRERIEAMETLEDEAREAVERLDKLVEKLRAPAYRVATFLEPVEPDLAHVCAGGTDYVCKLDPVVPLDSLQTGDRILLNEAFVVVRGLGQEAGGPVSRVEEVLSGGRLRMAQETSAASAVVQRSASLATERIKPGMNVRLDVNHRVALEIIGPGLRHNRSLEHIAPLPWSSIGGQDEAVQAIRDTIELPILHRDLFKKFDHTVPKGFLLYGPPGCGKTLLGKATAWNLRRQILEETRVDRPEFFLHVKGPEILNMWVGESERQVRDLFQQCRERAAEGALAFLFIDEADSILGTRHGGRIHSMVSTLVPMFCTEMDGLEPLQNVVVILASNRADLIDPAILRPGRIDRKIKVRRPDQAGAERIYAIYLKDSLPLAEAGAKLATAIAGAHFARTEANEFLEVAFRSGRREILHRGDLASGAIIAAVVERAKSLAIKRAIDGRADTVLTFDDLCLALQREYAENDLFPATDVTEDWLKLTDFDPDNVVRLGPIRPRHPGTSGRLAG